MKLNSLAGNGALDQICDAARTNLAVGLFARAMKEGWRERPLFLDEERALDYGSADLLSSKLAAVLMQLPGYRNGAVLAVHLPDSVNYALLILAGLKAGLALVPLSMSLSPATLDFIVQDCEALWLVSDATMPTKRRCLTLNLTELIATDAAPTAAMETPSDQVAFILYTSGSTGTPKGAIHEHKDAWLPADAYARQTLGLMPQDRLFSCAKLSFAYGLGASLYMPMFCGSSVYLSGATNAISFAESIERRGITVFFGIPSVYGDLCNVAESFDWRFAGVRLYVSAAEKLPVALARRWQQRFERPICEGVGTTELFHVFLSNHPNADTAGSCGRPVPGYQVDVVDDQGVPLSSGQGALRVAGASLMRGYLNLPELTRKVICPDESMFTGDIFHKDEKGFFRYMGRKDDLFKIKGQWVVPANLEEKLVNLPGVREVAVIRLDASRADSFTMQRCVVCAIADATVEAVALKQTILARLRDGNHQFPTIRDVFLYGNFPRNAHGKVDRLQLAALCLERTSTPPAFHHLEQYEQSSAT